MYKAKYLEKYESSPSRGTLAGLRFELISYDLTKQRAKSWNTINGQG